ncbi:hypothetical protein FW774_08145 [Pedobacter sp. BS3]|uniref:hypothetical protein n=1 Tax=Pedobacter sp. BS3 TaxID=2567937 RepID=UPI0011EC46B4|nr:hypothetical protein [Pedobacter sp. BS3]TZF84929.1 hypothetical protein FW774_08145 [Pedobacter sp. BS3]
MRTYPSLNVAVYDLRKRGYRLDFYFNSGFIICNPAKLRIRFNKVKIDETYSFPALHQPGNCNVICALTTASGIKGILYDCSGTIIGDQKPKLECSETPAIQDKKQVKKQVHTK